MAALAESTQAVVDTARVQGRRTLHFQRVDDILHDAEQLAQRGYHRLGNWNLGQCAKHLAEAVLMALDGAKFKAPWYLRLVARPLKNRFINKPLSPGFKAPKNVASAMIFPEDTKDEEGLAALRAAVERWRREPQRLVHPILGTLTPEEWEKFECRHAEMHLSFLLPEGS